MRASERPYITRLSIRGLLESILFLYGLRPFRASARAALFKKRPRKYHTAPRGWLSARKARRYSVTVNGERSVPGRAEARRGSGCDWFDRSRAALVVCEQTRTHALGDKAARLVVVNLRKHERVPLHQPCADPPKVMRERKQGRKRRVE